MDQFHDRAGSVVTDQREEVEAPLEVDRIDQPREKNSITATPEDLEVATVAPEDDAEPEDRRTLIQAVGQQAILQSKAGGGLAPEAGTDENEGQERLDTEHSERGRVDTRGEHDESLHQSPTPQSDGGGRKEPPGSPRATNGQEGEHQNGGNEGNEPDGVSNPLRAPVSFRMEADRPFEPGEEAGNSPFDQVLERARQTEVVEGT